jgi:hypothetical protein
MTNPNFTDALLAIRMAADEPGITMVTGNTRKRSAYFVKCDKCEVTFSQKSEYLHKNCKGQTTRLFITPDQ